MQLKDLDAQIAVPREAGTALKLFAEGRAKPAQQRLAWRFIVDALCGVERLNFLLADDIAAVDIGDIPMLLAWHRGRRHVGVQLLRIVETPMAEPEPPEPPARTITERHRRRNRDRPAPSEPVPEN